MNKAVALAKGDFIATQGSDDISEPRRFEEQIKCFTGNVGVVTTHGIAIDPEGKRIGDFYMDDAQRRSELEILKVLHKDWWVLGASLMFKKECFDKLGPFDPECYFAQDLNMWYRVINSDWDFDICRMELYRNRRHPRKDKKNYEKRKNTDWHKLAIDKAVRCPQIKST
jgi:hypothetical protein